MINRTTANSVCASQLSVCNSALRVTFADLPNLSVGQYRVALSHVASLVDHVPHVVLLGAQEQMIRIYTRRIIATVQNAKSVGDWAIGHMPRQAMRQNVLAAFLDCSVSVICTGGHPDPAGVGLAYALPKPNFQRHDPFSNYASPSRAGAATETRGPFDGYIASKRLATVWTFMLRNICDTMASGHGVTSEIGYKVSRLVRALQRSCGPFVFYHENTRAGVFN